MQPYDEQRPYTVPPTPYGQATPTYTGNQKDLNAFLGMVAGVGLLAVSCVPGGVCIVPIVALVLGILGLRGANESVNPSRTRTYGWIAVATGGLVLLFFVGIAVLYGAVIVAAINESNQLN